MDIIKIKPLNEMSFVELLSAYGRTVWAQANCQTMYGTEYAEHTQAIQAITEEAQRRDDRAKYGAMFAPKPVNREPDGDILFA